MSIKFGLPIHILELKAAGDDWVVEGYASTFGNADLGNDVVMPGAFDRTLADGSKKRFLHSHDPRMVLGVPTLMKVDKTGLFTRNKISKTRLGEETRQLVMDGAMDSFSIGYAAAKVDFVDNGAIRQLKDIDLYEISLVSMPMNEAAIVTGVKDYLSLLGITSDATLAEKAHALSEGLNQLLSDTRQLVGSADRSLTQTKRQELTELLEMFSGLDAVRSDLTSVLAAAPTVRASGKRALYELTQARARLAHILS